MHRGVVAKQFGQLSRGPGKTVSWDDFVDGIAAAVVDVPAEARRDAVQEVVAGLLASAAK